MVLLHHYDEQAGHRRTIPDLGFVRLHTTLSRLHCTCVMYALQLL